jgi:Invasion associated locus B (IalB) protein
MTVLRRHSILTILAVSLLCGTAAAARAADKVLGLFGDWGAQTFSEGKNTGCSIWSQPTKDKGDYSKRGAIYAYVTHRPWDKRLNEVSFSAGYAYKKDSTVQVLIGGQKFTLFTDGETAWSRSAKDDKALVDAMRRGSSMTVTGVSGRGTQTADTYSLNGFTKAFETIGKACNVK